MKQQNRMAQEKTQIGYTDSLSSVRGLKHRLVGSVLTALILLAGIGVPRAFAADEIVYPTVNNDLEVPAGRLPMTLIL